MADQVLIQPMTIASQVVQQTNLNVQQSREALQQAREADIEEAVNNPNPERVPVDTSSEAGADKKNDGQSHDTPSNMNFGKDNGRGKGVDVFV